MKNKLDNTTNCKLHTAATSHVRQRQTNIQPTNTKLKGTQLHIKVQISLFDFTVSTLLHFTEQTVDRSLKLTKAFILATPET